MLWGALRSGQGRGGYPSGRASQHALGHAVPPGAQRKHQTALARRFGGKGDEGDDAVGQQMRRYRAEVVGTCWNCCMKESNSSLAMTTAWNHWGKWCINWGRNMYVSTEHRLETEVFELFKMFVDSENRLDVISSTSLLESVCFSVRIQSVYESSLPKPKNNYFTQSGISLKTISGYCCSDSGWCHSARRTARIIYSAPARSKLQSFRSRHFVLGRQRTWATSYTGANNQGNRSSRLA